MSTTVLRTRKTVALRRGAHRVAALVICWSLLGCTVTPVPSPTPSPSAEDEIPRQTPADTGNNSQTQTNGNEPGIPGSAAQAGRIDLYAAPLSSTEVAIEFSAPECATVVDIHIDDVFLQSAAANGPFPIVADGLMPGTNHGFQVFAECAGEQIASNIVFVTTPGDTPAAEGILLAATPLSPNEIELEWTAIACAEVYEITLDSAPIGTVAADEPTPLVIGGLTAETTYSFQVAATCDGLLTASNVATVATFEAGTTEADQDSAGGAGAGAGAGPAEDPALQPPAPPSNLVVKRLTTDTSPMPGYMLTWQDNSDNEDGFIVEVIGGQIGVNSWMLAGQTEANETTFYHFINVRGVDAYRVWAFNDAGQSESAAVRQLNGPSITLSAEALSPTEAELTWTEPDALRDREVLLDGNAVATLADGDPASFTIGGLTPGSTHDFLVRGTRAGAAIESNTVTITMPAQGTITLRAEVLTPTDANLYWSELPCADEFDILQDGQVIGTLPNDGQYAAELFDLEPGTTHTFQVTAVCSGRRIVSNEVTITTFDAFFLEVAGTTTTTVHLRWTQLACSSEYRVRMDGVILGAQLAANATECTVTDLAPGQTHQFEIVGNCNSLAVFSNEVTATTQGQQTPSLPELVGGCWWNTIPSTCDLEGHCSELKLEFFDDGSFVGYRQDSGRGWRQVIQGVVTDVSRPDVSGWPVISFTLHTSSGDFDFLLDTSYDRISGHLPGVNTAMHLYHQTGSACR